MSLKGPYLALRMPLVEWNEGELANMIIFIITFAIIGLFALTLTGSIATASRRRS